MLGTAQELCCRSMDQRLPSRGPSLPPSRAAWVSTYAWRAWSERRARTGLRAPWKKSSTARLRWEPWVELNFVSRDGSFEPMRPWGVSSWGGAQSEPRAWLCEPQQSARVDRLGRRGHPRAQAPRSLAARHPPCREVRAASRRASRTQGYNWAECAVRADEAAAAEACSERAA